jgi:basic amino acid/polyamine antiporter, APA family
MTPSKPAGLGLGTGIGLVAANMIGTGVFVTAGFMAQELGPGLILLAWAVGTVAALAGARAYAEIARVVPDSGGEYRYLSRLWHPFLGVMAGWASLLVGFSAPIAAAALAAGHFVRTLVPGAPPRAVGLALLVVITAAHAGGFGLSRRSQDALVVVKAALLLAFVVVGLAHAPASWPAWVPPRPAPSPAVAFTTSLFFVAFAFSGWNAAVYAAAEFRRPERDVPRALLGGCALVGAAYLVVNWVFVASLTPAQAAVVLDDPHQQVTLGHLVMREALGEAGGRAMSVITLVALASSVSAMTFVGPRVYAAMAQDGVLPHALAFGPDGHPPARSVILQGLLAAAILLTHELRQVLANLGALLTLFAALTALGVFRTRRLGPGAASPSILGRLAGGVYAASGAVMLAVGFGLGRIEVWWTLGVLAPAALFFALRRPQAPLAEGRS